jgi:hypothetical protein
MSEPTIEIFQALATNQGISLSDRRIADAVANHAGLRAQVEALRAVPLSFLEPVLEPGTALAWIERGGRSS